MYESLSQSLRPRHRDRPNYVIHAFDLVDSTNAAAKRMLMAAAEVADIADAHIGTVVVAREQSAGRGRLGREWISPRDAGLYCSIIIKLSCAKTKHILSLAGGAAVMLVLRRYYGLDALIKWPNDVYIRDRKVSGILIEGFDGDVFIVGIGINTNWSAPRDKTALSFELGHSVDHVTLLKNILEVFDSIYASLRRGQTRFILGRVRRHLWGVGREVYCTDGSYRGIFEGIDDEGCAIVRAENTRIAVRSGEVSFAHRD